MISLKDKLLAICDTVTLVKGISQILRSMIAKKTFTKD